MADGTWVELEKDDLMKVERELAAILLTHAGQYPTAEDGFDFSNSHLSFFLHIEDERCSLQAVSVGEPVGPTLLVGLAVLADIIAPPPLHIIPKRLAVALIGSDWPLGPNFDWKGVGMFGIYPAGQFGDVQGDGDRLVVRGIRDFAPVGPPLTLSTYIPEGYEPGE